MDRDLYKKQFRKGNTPEWTCPNCKKSVLRCKKDTFNYFETAGSKISHSHEAFEYHWVHFVYSCILECSDSQCKEVVTNLGVGYYEHHRQYIIFVLRCVHPASKLVTAFQDRPENPFRISVFTLFCVLIVFYSRKA